MKTIPPIVVVGSGLTGLFTTLCLALSNQQVVLLSADSDLKSAFGPFNMGLYLPSVNAANEPRLDNFAQEFIRMSDFLCDQYLANDFAKKIPHIFQLLQRLGVVFDRREEGIFWDSETIDVDRRLLHAGYLTRLKIASKIRAAVIELIALKKITFRPHTSFMKPILDSKNNCRGVLVINKKTMESLALPAASVIMCTGGYEGLFEKTTQSHSLGAAIGSLYQEGAMLANPEMIQHEIVFKGLNATLQAAPLVEILGGRYWIKKDGRPWYFLEDLYPQFKNNLPQIVVGRAILKLKEKGVKDFFVEIPKDNLLFGQPSWRHFSTFLQNNFGQNIDLTAMPIDLAVADTLGGLWVNQNFETNIPGLLAAGGAQYQLKGASVLSGYKIGISLFSAFQAAEQSMLVAAKLLRTFEAVPAFLFDEACQNDFRKNRSIMDLRGAENTYRLIDELKMLLSRDAGFVRDNRTLQDLLEKIREMKFRLKEVLINDRSLVYNQELLMYRDLENVLPLVEACVKSALLRDESRGCHFKPQFSERNDMNYLKTTRVRCVADLPKVEYEDIPKTDLRNSVSHDAISLPFNNKRAS